MEIDSKAMNIYFKRLKTKLFGQDNRIGRIGFISSVSCYPVKIKV